MKISGAAIIRNGVKLKFQFVESIRSVLPLCGEFVVAVGDSDDGTRERIESINDPKIKIIDTKWDMDKRSGGQVLSEQTNIALCGCSGDWIFYIQSDEAVSEKDFDKINLAVDAASKRDDIDGLAFGYLHFYGSYNTFQSGKNWYPQEIRLVKNDKSIVSHGDAQGFRKNGKKLRGIACGADIYHYGWARQPEVMAEKIRSFHKLWHDDSWVEKNCSNKSLPEFYTDLGNLREFRGSHPAAMSELVSGDSSDFILKCRDQYLKKRGLLAFAKDALRRTMIGQHRNFILVK